MKPKIFLILILLAPFYLSAQSANIQFQIASPGDTCIGGEYIAFFDDNADNRYDRVSKIFCDKTYQDFILDANYIGYFDNSMEAKLMQGKFRDYEIIIEVRSKIDKALKAVLLYSSQTTKYILYFPDKNIVPDNNKLFINPNPAKDFVYIKYKDEHHFSFLVSDETGKNVTEKIKIISDYNSSIKVDISNLISGIYIVKIGNSVGKFVKI